MDLRKNANTRFQVALKRQSGLNRNWRETTLATRGTAMEIGVKVIHKQEEGKAICPLTTRKSMLIKRTKETQCTSSQIPPNAEAELEN